MDIKELITEVRENYMEADLPQLEIWQGRLSTEFAWICEQLAEVKRDRAKEEISIKKALIESGIKPTEKEVERDYFATESGMYYAWGSEILKALSKLISAVRFKIEALRGRV